MPQFIVLFSESKRSSQPQKDKPSGAVVHSKHTSTHLTPSAGRHATSSKDKDASHHAHRRSQPVHHDHGTTTNHSSRDQQARHDHRKQGPVKPSSTEHHHLTVIIANDHVSAKKSSSVLPPAPHHSDRQPTDHRVHRKQTPAAPVPKPTTEARRASMDIPLFIPPPPRIMPLVVPRMPGTSSTCAVVGSAPSEKHSQRISSSKPQPKPAHDTLVVAFRSHSTDRGRKR